MRAQSHGQRRASQNERKIRNNTSKAQTISFRVYWANGKKEVAVYICCFIFPLSCIREIIISCCAIFSSFRYGAGFFFGWHRMRTNLIWNALAEIDATISWWLSVIFSLVFFLYTSFITYIQTC